ncbi:flagellar motor protein MotB [Malaciobacter molluscorum LMG 25693]|uniref:Flagellar motor protein MotB n=1 Tax=Malaciobacter molluscorum LMG 25693 TaxID=870501 RepID=A0A2G1DFA9_9BACT|nr:OmpA family protein [Malaciobacter molluscorum]AXX91539.1 outer membrane fibronectin-binding protein [Malaciobacter molluscorum LMG 25693]PHO17177.1 flagellar motor protein MotB [Malaciobacter molluscorum LMG 25693]RXJ92764.1 flagellar motor protein MotB [Malaciobacter molluscorum]
MKKVLLSTILCSSLMFAASEYKYEITPIIGGAITEGNTNLDDDYGVGGLSLGFNLDDKSFFNQVELGFLNSLGEVDYRHGGDTQITRLFTNVIKDFEITKNSSIYGLVGAGVEVFSNEDNRNDSGLFGNYGIGYKYKFTDDIALKTDIRHLINADHGDNTLLYTVGLAISFGKKATNVAPVQKQPVKEEPIAAKKEEPKKMAQLDEIDSDGDGVPDSIDQCPNTPKGDFVDKVGCSLKTDLNINFAFDSAKINNSYESKIKRFAEFMKKFPTTKAKIEAHTDAIGTKEYNQKLSERRALSTVEALKAYKIDKSRLKSYGYGESRPIATNETKEGRAKNRRVEATIIK